MIACAEPAKAPAARAEETSLQADTTPAPSPVKRDSTWVDVVGPTLIAFYPASATAEIDSSSDEATALDDFGYHLASAHDSLRALGFRIVSVGSRTLTVVNGGATTTFRVPRDSADLGFYYVAPGRDPVVYYGAQAEDALIDFAHAYLARPPARP